MSRTFDQMLEAAYLQRGGDFYLTFEESTILRSDPRVLPYISLLPGDSRPTFLGHPLEEMTENDLAAKKAKGGK